MEAARNWATVSLFREAGIGLGDYDEYDGAEDYCGTIWDIFRLSDGATVNLHDLNKAL